MATAIVSHSLQSLVRDGVVRIDGVLSEATAAALRTEVIAMRDAARAAVAGGAPPEDHFADVLLNDRRCDLLLPLHGARSVQLALRELLVGGGGGGATASTPLRKVLSGALGDGAVLYELAALVSEPGAPRQPVHPDNPYQPCTPLLTCFIALQDIGAEMGATAFVPGTHTAAAHAEFEDPASRDALLARAPSSAALLCAGDAALFDSRTLHCGGANDAARGATRALFYVSFRNPRAERAVGNVGSLRRDVKPLALRELCGKLAMLDGDARGPAADPFDDAEDEAEAVRFYRTAAERGAADAQFNLGLCYRRGEGVERDAAEAARWFRRAAEQGMALAQCNLGTCCYAGEGVAKDDAEAARLFLLAAEQGNAPAQHNLGFCLLRGIGVARDLDQAAAMLQLAAEQEHPGASELRLEALNEMAAE